MVHLNYKIKEVFFMIFGYARVSTDDQNLSLQIDALTSFMELINYFKKK